MEPIFKICMIAILFCGGIFSTVEGLESDHKTWKTFLLSRNIDPVELPDYSTWDAEKWYDVLHERQELLSEECPSCLSLKELDISSVFVAPPLNIDASFFVEFHPVDHKAAWSFGSFDTYILYRNNVFNCGPLYFLAQVDKNGLPTETLALDNTKDRSSPIHFKCENINPDTTDQLKDGLLMEFGGEIPQEDFAQFIPEHLSLRIMPGNVELHKEL